MSAAQGELWSSEKCVAFAESSSEGKHHIRLETGAACVVKLNDEAVVLLAVFPSGIIFGMARFHEDQSPKTSGMVDRDHNAVFSDSFFDRASKAIANCEASFPVVPMMGVEGVAGLKLMDGASTTLHESQYYVKGDSFELKDLPSMSSQIANALRTSLWRQFGAR